MVVQIQIYYHLYRFFVLQFDYMVWQNSTYRKAPPEAGPFCYLAWQQGILAQRHPFKLSHFYITGIFQVVCH